MSKSKYLKLSLELTNEGKSQLTDNLYKQFLSKIRDQGVLLTIKSDKFLSEYCRKRLHMKHHTNNGFTEVSNHAYLLVKFLHEMRSLDETVSSFMDTLNPL